MVVECAICVGDIQTMVPGVEMTVQEFVYVERAVPEVLPGVDAEPRRPENILLAKWISPACGILTWQRRAG